MLLLTLVLCLAQFFEICASRCLVKEYGKDNIVCVCNEEECHTLVPPDSNLPKGKVVSYESNIIGKRMEPKEHYFTKKNFPAETQVFIDASKTFQEIFGFGGAFTDAVGINLLSLPKNVQDDLLQSYYGLNGLEYTFGRVPMASCDFSLNPYSYCDTPNDFELKTFALTEEDFKYKIPFIQRAKEMVEKREGSIRLIGSPWTSPPWMKTNNNVSGVGKLKGEVGGRYYQTWVNYFVRFLQEYKKHNLSFWGLTVQNEPTNGNSLPFGDTGFIKFESLGYTAEAQRDFIKKNLGPTLESENFGVDKVKLMILDDQRNFAPKWPITVLSDRDAAKYVSGTAFHWYANMFTDLSILNEVHESSPRHFILSTEACNGAFPGDNGVLLGSWSRAEAYATDIIQTLSHWNSGWVDWNLCLNTEGGPNWVNNFVDAPIIVNATGREFYKQPMYYALAHFSKFISPGSRLIQVTVHENPKELEIVGFITPRNQTGIIVLNKGALNTTLEGKYDSLGKFHNVVPAHSIQSYIWNNNHSHSKGTISGDNTFV